MNKPHKMQIWFNESDLERLDALKKRLGFHSRAATIQRAIQKALEATRARRVLLEKEDGIVREVNIWL